MCTKILYHALSCNKKIDVGEFMDENVTNIFKNYPRNLFLLCLKFCSLGELHKRN